MEDWDSWIKEFIEFKSENYRYTINREALYLSFKSRLLQELSGEGLQITPIQEPEKKKRANNGFKKPELVEVIKYCRERNRGVDARAFYDFYEAKNWMIGKNKMKDWKAAVRTWESRVERKEDLSAKRTHASQKLWKP